MTDEQPGTTNARLSRLEGKYDDLARQVSSAVQTVERVENNQKHAEELNKLRFDSLDKTVTALAGDVKGWMQRMEGVFTGEVQTAASRDLKAAKEQAEREGTAIMAEWSLWRKDVDKEMDALRALGDRLQWTGTILKFALGGSIIGALGTLVSIYVALNPR